MQALVTILAEKIVAAGVAVSYSVGGAVQVAH